MKTPDMNVLVLLLALTVCGCQSTTSKDKRESLHQQLTVEEQMFAKIVLTHFDMTHAGETVIGIWQKTVSPQLLDYLNCGKMKFVTGPRPPGFTSPLFYLRFVDYFYPGYAYVQVENAGAFRQFAYGFVFRKSKDWELVNRYAFDDWTMELDRAAYIKKQIEIDHAAVGK